MESILKMMKKNGLKMTMTDKYHEDNKTNYDLKEESNKLQKEFKTLFQDSEKIKFINSNPDIYLTWLKINNGDLILKILEKDGLKMKLTDKYYEESRTESDLIEESKKLQKELNT